MDLKYVFLIMINISLVFCHNEMDCKDKNTIGLGSWSLLDLKDKTKMDDHTKRINNVVATLTKTYNSRSNSLVELNPKQYEIEEVYFQMANGFNYCIVYRPDSNICKNNAQDNLCKAKFRCKGEAYVSFEGKVDLKNDQVKCVEYKKSLQ